MGNYKRKTIKKSINADKNWTLKEDKILINCYNKLKYEDIAKILNRTPNACRGRLYHIRLKNGEISKKVPIKYKNWTIKEDNFLKKYYPDNGALWCCQKLNRTKKACIHRAGFLNLKRSYRWKQSDDDVIRKYYPKYGGKKVSEILGRNKETCLTRAFVLGVKYNNTSLWTEDEIKFIKKHYPKEGIEYVAKALNRTETAIKSKAAILKLKRPKLWTKEEKNFLKKHYPTKGGLWVSKHLNRSHVACRNYARKNGIKYINENLWCKEDIIILKKYYPLIGKYVAELIPNKDMDACTRLANRLKISYTKKYSSSVLKIKSILDENKVIYKQEVGFEKCVDKKMLYFDFAIYEDIQMNNLIGLIEFDGSQHFFASSLYSDSKISSIEVLHRTQRHDQIKNNFCKKYAIPLLRIKYSQENIEELVLDFLNNFDNYTEWYNPWLSFFEYYDTLNDKKLKDYYINFSRNRKYASKSNLTFYVNKWTEEDELFLKKHYPKKGSIWVANHLHRTKESCRQKANCLGIYRSNHWDKKEDAFVIKYYKEKGPLWIANELDRTFSSITHRANRLGCHKIKGRWDKEEDDYLIEFYMIKKTADIAAYLNRTIMGVQNRVRVLRNKGIVLKSKI